MDMRKVAILIVVLLVGVFNNISLSSSGSMDNRFDGIWVRKGQNPYGDILYNVDGKWIRKGQNPFGEIVFTIQKR